MSIQAVAWALKQDLPGTSKLVLIALCNRADEETGHCWPSISRISKEASCSPRSVHTYIGALKRNGYLDVRSGRGKTGGVHTNDYWILMDRPPAPWDFGKREPDPECLSATVADLADGVSATGLQTKPSESESSVESESLTSQSVVGIPTPQAAAPPGFNPQHRRQEVAKQRAAEEARSKNQQVPVLEGSDPWKAWVARGHAPDLATWVIFDGNNRRGWYFPSLWPPRSTGPPAPALMTAEDETELVKGIG